ncbi:UDP-2,4-diacetamido-2,4,6-trideoxy-beta-L-altropyranose hydrolase [Robertmurraya korlensis]|jgi:UDP-2,4-diacetamido-2,4,6-trideoxy-beta-L-altropyranose hydrolase|uniref:UDP-2,4-diacetamido-2,4, 6-trideoxy-beta-L-altropyranose hydrolase n=1 Tax=Robertmurraya korlensis TaxID=519977 RepID=UPI000826419E|nr:UDP-2,4-diacetamido-2,4,6-trideoxy-beta-L-altropyranose hydrolase [Robertmurraya korlensis]
MNIVIRVDSSFEIGTGHVMRCLTLAEVLRRKGARISFICRDLPGNLGNYLIEKGFNVCLLPPPKNCDQVKYNHLYESWLKVPWQIDAEETIEILKVAKPVDGLIVDHYAIDKKWEVMVKAFVGKIVIIDDLANRPHDCKILLDQNFSNESNRYNHLLPNNCVKLLGTGYAILREEFRRENIRMEERSGQIKNLLIFFGGTDPTSETIKALKGLNSISVSDLHINVVVGKSNPYKHLIKEECDKALNISYHCQIENMAELMREADLSIGAGGSTTWERCFLGLPSIVIATAENQVEITRLVNSKGAIHYLGLSETVTQSMIANAVEDMLTNPKRVKIMSEKARALMGDSRFNEIIERIMEVENAG